MKSLMFRSALIASFAFVTTFAMADDLSPRAEINFKAGTERSILTTEFWAPLAQQNDRVLYGDLRLMGDDGDNREGNLGFGYRQISVKTNSVLGGNVWIDRRRTENGNYFHQLTLGVESLGDKIDVRANGYIQLNNSKTTITPNIGSANPYLSGTGIFYDTNGFIIEEPQDGFDAEVGYRLPILQKHIDATRVYVGGYHFWGDTTDNVTGFRLRTEAQVNSIFSIGARFQHDGPRGSQGFLEATLRFPFKSKKLYQEDNLRSRLDESPERDIDIVTGNKVDTGLMKPVLNTSGTTQRILYVDNTNTNAGDGSKDNPFNTLKAAEAALQDNDILYVRRGDGTTTGMDQGITIEKQGVSLIGSGSALTYSGYTLLDSGIAPLITNTQAVIPASNEAGNAVSVYGDNALISGLSISDPQKHGIYATTLNGTTLNSLMIDNLNIYISSAPNTNFPIFIFSQGGGTIGSVSVSNIQSSGGNGIGFDLNTNSTINNIRASNISQTAFGNTRGIRVLNIGGTVGTVDYSNINIMGGSEGIYFSSRTFGTIDKINLSNATSNNTTNAGLYIESSGGVINEINIDALTTNFNKIGTLINPSTGSIGKTTISNLSANSNLQYGIYLWGTSATGSLNNTTISNFTANSNSIYGIFVNSAAGSINNTLLVNGTTNLNSNTGTISTAGTTGAINGLTISNVVSNNNTRHGILVNTTNNSAATINNAVITNSDTLYNGINGIYLQKLNAASVFNVDLGGGLYNGTGNNRSFANTNRDLVIDYTGGGNVFAKNNWWGVNTGLAAGRVTLSASTTVDSTAYLITDPRP